MGFGTFGMEKKVDDELSKHSEDNINTAIILYYTL